MPAGEKGCRPRRSAEEDAPGASCCRRIAALEEYAPACAGELAKICALWSGNFDEGSAEECWVELSAGCVLSLGDCDEETAGDC